MLQIIKVNGLCSMVSDNEEITKKIKEAVQAIIYETKNDHKTSACMFSTELELNLTNGSEESFAEVISGMTEKQILSAIDRAVKEIIELNNIELNNIEDDNFDDDDFDSLDEY